MGELSGLMFFSLYIPFPGPSSFIFPPSSLTETNCCHKFVRGSSMDDGWTGEMDVKDEREIRRGRRRKYGRVFTVSSIGKNWENKVRTQDKNEMQDFKKVAKLAIYWCSKLVKAWSSSIWNHKNTWKNWHSQKTLTNVTWRPPNSNLKRQNKEARLFCRPILLLPKNFHRLMLFLFKGSVSALIKKVSHFFSFPHLAISHDSKGKKRGSGYEKVPQKKAEEFQSS